MFAVKVGDGVGTVFAMSYDYSSANMHKVTKINGHGHVHLDNGEVYNKHGIKRNTDSFQSEKHLVEANAVHAEKAAIISRNHMNLIIGNRYNWKYQPERLVYLGQKGVWHQFSKVGLIDVWCEVLDEDLLMLEETKE